jgi:hypothetical protein
MAEWWGEQTERDRELAAELADVCADEARLAAHKAAIIAEASQSGAPARAGHRSVKGWVRAATGCAAPTAARAAQLSRGLTRLPGLAEAMAAGWPTLDHAEAMVRLHRNARARAAVEDAEQFLLGMARLPYPDWCRALARFEAHADPDGAALSHDRARDQRRAGVGSDGVVFRFDASGDAAAGAEITAIFDAFVQAEFARDVAVVDAGGDMPRTAGQRSFDAFHEMCLAAARSGAVRLPDPLVVYVIDHATYHHVLDREPGSRRGREAQDRSWYRSETIDGAQIDPRWIVRESIRGRVLRVVVDDDHVALVQGRKRRLFAPTVREAVAIRFQHCVWPGCEIPVSRSQLDHRTSWLHHGQSDPANGQPLCPHHNRLRGPISWDTS